MLSPIYVCIVVLQISVSGSSLSEEADDGSYSRSLANFVKIRQELELLNDKEPLTVPRTESVLASDGVSGPERRADVSNPLHEGWNGNLLRHLKTQQIPDFGHHEIHTMDEHGESFHLDSEPRHHVHHGHHHMPHYHHEVHTFHHDGEHPHSNHEHFVHHEPIYHHVPIMHHSNHHVDHHDDEESGDHEEHHDEESMHGDTDDWDVGGGYFQLEEHGSDVNVVALKKHGTKVHMSGGDFNVIRDPWRHHSLFAGLFHPHEMPGHGHFPMEQFHQHFTYIANDRAINHHVYQHHTHNEDNHIHEHDPGHEHDYFYHHTPEPNNSGGKREFNRDPSVNVTARAQVKQEITGSTNANDDIITIPLSFARNVQRSPSVRNGFPIVPSDISMTDGSQVVSSQGTNSLPVTEMAEVRGEHGKVVKSKKELPKGKSPRFSPFNGNRLGPRYLGNPIEVPLGPMIIKRQIPEQEMDNAKSRTLVRRSLSNKPGNRAARLKNAFLGKLLLSKSLR